MNVAFLFDSDAEEYGGFYGDAIQAKILGTGVLQNVKRHMRVSVGDVLTYMYSGRAGLEGHLDLCRQTYDPAKYDKIIWDRLEPTFGTRTVYTWLFQNMPVGIADRLNAILSSDETYLGAQGVDFSNPLHLQLYRNSLIERYRFFGRAASNFGDELVEEDPDVVMRENFESNGFTLTYECIGLRRTIFDPYDSIEHFTRIGDFRRYFETIPGLDEDIASEITLHIEELHPKLFDGFAAAARTLARAETAEDYAQAAISGRRLLERVADYLFPPQTEQYNGRSVGKAEYRNRLWAYISDTLMNTGGDQITLQWLGKEADRLVELFNSGLHADSGRAKVEAAFRDLVVWLSNVIALDPVAIRKSLSTYSFD